MTVVSARDTFPVRFLNIFVGYLLGSMKVGNKLWTNWNKAPMQLWQTQLNFAVWCASSACGVSSDNPFTKSKFFKISEDYRVSNDPMKCRDEKFYWTYQWGVTWPNDHIGPDSMTWWIIEKSQGFTDVGLYRISESVRAYVYLILSSQASMRSGIVRNTVSALTAPSAFLNNFENVGNRRVDIQEDFNCYQDTLSYASSKVDQCGRKYLHVA